MKKRRKLVKVLKDIPDLNFKETKGVAKVFDFWNSNPLFFKPVKKIEKNCEIRQTNDFRNFSFVVLGLFNGSIYKSTIFGNYKEVAAVSFSASSIISVLRDIMLFVDKGKINNKLFFENNDFKSVFLGNDYVSSFFVEAYCFRNERRIKEEKRKRLQITPKQKDNVVNNLTVPHNVQMLINYWNKQKVLKPFVVGKSGKQTKEYKETVRNLKRYLKKDLFVSKKYAVVPTEFDFSRHAEKDPFSYWKKYVDRYILAMTDDKFFPKNKEFISKFNNLSMFISGMKYSKTPIPSFIITYGYNPPKRIQKPLMYDKKFHAELLKVLNKTLPHITLIYDEVLDNCLKIIDEETAYYYKKIHRALPINRMANGIHFLPFLIKKQWKDISKMNISYISSKGFKQLFRNNFRG